MQTSDVIASLALTVSILSAVFSWWEARKSRKTSQAQELAPHFINVGYVWSIVMQEGGDNQDVEAGKKSIEFLKRVLSADREFQNCIKELAKWAEDAVMLVLTSDPKDTSMSFKSMDIPVAAVKAKEVFDRKQRQYISIG